MRKFLLLVLTVLFINALFAQDFSNKGKEFWLVFPAHLPSGNAQAMMGLFITSDKNSSGTITVNGYSTTFTVVANQVTGPINIPYGVANVGVTNVVMNRGIHVVTNAGQPAVVLYAHIYAGFRSEASLILPVNTLGKKYYSTNFFQRSTGGSQSQFNVVAVEPNTVIQYQLRVNGVLNPVPVTVNLPNVGDQIQVQNNDDLTGSVIESIASGTSTCKKIAVFSGSSSLSIGSQNCGTANSFDPLYQQCYPISTWGKNFGVVPLSNNPNGYHYRVIAAEDNTLLNVDGTTISLNAGEYYPATSASPVAVTTPLSITADKPISVSQYMMSYACTGSRDYPNQTNPQGDPDMIILNPVEQNISDINIFSSNLQNIRTKYLNVYMKTDATGSFTINGNPPNSFFTPMPQNNGYSYLQENLTGYASTSFRLKADSGFNAITYGMGDAESYGYSAGTNVKDLYQQIGTSSQYGIEAIPSVCTGEDFKFKMSLPYQPDSIYFDLTPTYPGVWIKPLIPGNPVPFDSIRTINGKQVWWYSLPNTYTYNTVGTYPIKVTVYKQLSDGCGNTQDIDFDLEVSARPVISFTANTPRCIAETVNFTENTVSAKPVYKWWWDFADPASGAPNNTSAIANPSHVFSSPGTYKVRYANITTAGCLSDTVFQNIIVAPLPSATIAGTTAMCQNGPAPTITFTGSGGAAPFTFTYNINGGAAQTITTSTGNSVTIAVPTAVIGVFRYNLTNVQNTGSTLCTAAQTGFAEITITDLPTATIGTSTSVCQNSASPVITFTGINGKAPYKFTYNINGAANQVISTTGVNSTVTLAAPTGTAGTFIYNIINVADVNICDKNLTGISATVVVNGLPTATITGTTQACLNGTSPNITFIGANGVAPYKFGYKINGGATLFVTSATNSNTVTLPVSTAATGTFTYTLVNVTDGSSTACTQAQTGSAVVTVKSLPTASISGNSTLCLNAASPVITFTGGGGTAPYKFGYKINNGTTLFATTTAASNTITINAPTNVAGTFTYSLVDVTEGSATACNQLQSGTVNIVINALPTATISGTIDVCLNAASPAVTFTGANGTAPYRFGYKINNGPTLFATTAIGSNTVTVSAPTSVAGTFNYTLVDIREGSALACSQGQVGSAVVVVKPLPTATIAGTNTVCLNSTSPNITFTGSNGTAPYTFGYKINGGATQFTTSGVNSNTVTVAVPTTTAGSFAYSLVNVTEGSVSCTQVQTGTAAITVKTLPTAVITGNATLCLNSPFPTITFTAAGGTAPYTFGYKINNGATLFATTTAASNSVSITAPTNVAGAFAYTLVNVAEGSTTACSQLQSSSINIVVNALPTATIAGTADACLNSASPVITFTGANGTAPYRFRYKINNGPTLVATTTASNNSVTVSAPTNVIGTFIYTLVDVQEGSALACTQSQTGAATITVKPLPTATIAGANDLCLNATPPVITFTGAGGTAPYKFGYKINSGTTLFVTSAAISNTASVTVPTSTAGTFTYTLVDVTEGSASLCTQPQTGSASVVVNVLPTAAFTSTAPYCQSGTISFNSTSSTANVGTITGWEWNFGDPSSGTANTTASQNPTHVFANAGSYTVTLKVTTNKGCVSIVTPQTIVINANPVANFTADPVCYLDAFAQFKDISSVPGGSIVGWQWVFGDANATPANPNASNVQNATHKYVLPGVYQVQLTVTSNSGCKTTVQLPITVNGGPVTNAIPLNNGVICGYDTVSIQNKSTAVSGALTKIEIYWDNTNAPTVVATDATPVFDEIYKHRYPSFQSPATKIFNVRVRAYTGASCFADQIIPVIVNATPKVAFTDLPAGCLDVPAYRITQATETGGLAGSGVYSGPGVIMVSPGIYNFSPALAGQGTHTIKYVFTSAAGCVDSISKQVIVYPNPVVNAGPDVVVLQGGSITLQPTVSGSDLQYLWLQNTYLNNNRIKNPVATPPVDITYQLTVTGRGGCIASDDLKVSVLEAPKIPNTFSPNNDGINDFWEIKYLDTYPNNRVQVFTRTGKLVFESHGYKKPWDGNMNGKSLPVDTYYYIIEPESGRKPVTGFVTIIK